MVRAHSLLYAIYICLLVALLCSGLLYFSNLFTQLNEHYNLQEELFLHNQSVVNFALGNKGDASEFPKDDFSSIEGEYEVKQHGLLSVLTAKTFFHNDTIASCQMVGNFDAGKVGLYVANLSKGISYAGDVNINGDCFLPSSLGIQAAYLNNKPSLLKVQGDKYLSEIHLPEINQKFKNVFEDLHGVRSNFEENTISDTIYFNSFKNTIKEIIIPSVLTNKIIKGNFILRNKDSIRVKKNMILEDVILIAPKISFEDGFKGTVQAFATNEIVLEKTTILKYPSVICVYNQNAPESFIRIKPDCKIQGCVVMFGNAINNLDKNKIEIEEGGTILGDIYCTGKLNVKGRVFGSVYASKIFHKTTSASYDNLIADVEINTKKVPPFFIRIPLFDTEKSRYGVIKKVQ